MLVTGKDCLEAKYHGTISRLRAIFEQSRSKGVSRRQRMVVTDQDSAGFTHAGVQLLTIDDRFVRLKCAAEILQIFTATVWIVDTDFAFDTRQGVQLRLVASLPQIGG